MTRETKIGVLLVLVLAGVFGFLVYKRATSPIEPCCVSMLTRNRH